MSETYSTTVLFEHPLNEKMRTWLRLEFLLQQLYHCPELVDISSALPFFRTVSDLLDVLERGDVRTEMLKELERQQQKMLQWDGVPGVDSERVRTLRNNLKQCAAVLMAAPRLGAGVAGGPVNRIGAPAALYSRRVLQFRFARSAYLAAFAADLSQQPGEYLAENPGSLEYRIDADPGFSPSYRAL